MEQQRPQAHLLFGHIGRVRTVEPARKADDAVKIPPLAGGPDLIGQRHQRRMAARIGMPVGRNRLFVVAAVVAPAPRVEHDVRVRGVHDAVAADLIVRYFHKFI